MRGNINAVDGAKKNTQGYVSRGNAPGVRLGRIFKVFITL